MKDLSEKLKQPICILPEAGENAFISEWLEFDKRGANTALIFTEELAELISAISKHEGRPTRQNEETLLHIAEELADVQIISKMIQQHYNFSDELLAKIRTLKLTVPIPSDTDAKNEPAVANQNKSEYTADELIDLLNEFITYVHIASGIRTTPKTPHPRFADKDYMPADKDIFEQIAIRYEKVIKYGKNLSEANNLLNFLSYPQTQEISMAIRTAIDQLRYSEIDPCLWSISEEKISSQCMKSWVWGLLILSVWLKCLRARVDNICYQQPADTIFWINTFDTFDQPFEIPITYYKLICYLRSDNKTLLKSDVDVLDSFSTTTRKLITTSALEQIVDEIIHVAPAIEGILFAEFNDPLNLDCKLSAISTYLQRI